MDPHPYLGIVDQDPRIRLSAIVDSDPQMHPENSGSGSGSGSLFFDYDF